VIWAVNWERGQGTISDFWIRAEWDAIIHTRDLCGLRLLVPIPAGEGGAVFGGWFNVSGSPAMAGPGQSELRH